MRPRAGKPTGQRLPVIDAPDLHVTGVLRLEPDAQCLPQFAAGMDDAAVKRAQFGNRRRVWRGVAVRPRLHHGFGYMEKARGLRVREPATLRHHGENRRLAHAGTIAGPQRG